MSSNNHQQFDMKARARQAMHDEQFSPDLPPDAQSQLDAILQPLAELPSDTKSVDLRHLLWSSIDNTESRDLDQIEFAEELADGNIRLLIGIADVDSTVPRDTPIDRHAAANTVSVYTGVSIFPMLPDAISEDKTSLLSGVDREAVIIEMVIDKEGNVVTRKVYSAVTHNFAKLSYEEIGDWLAGECEAPDNVARLDGLEGQIQVQKKAADRISARRKRQGALDFETVEARPVMQNGQVVDLEVPRKNPARQIIENFMICANTTIADRMEKLGIASLQRVVRSPKRWPRIREIAAGYHYDLPEAPDPRALSAFLTARRQADPVHFPDLSLSIVKLLGAGEYTVIKSELEDSGHFGLAVYSYTHSTAPNRRFADLVVQRLLKAVIANTPQPYSESELHEIAAHCTERENAARKVERVMRKAIAAELLSDRMGDSFDAIVTGASPKGVFVRLLKPPVEGRIVHGEQGLDVGDKTRVRLIHTDPEHGFIDFERIY